MEKKEGEIPAASLRTDEGTFSSLLFVPLFFLDQVFAKILVSLKIGK